MSNLKVEGKVADFCPKCKNCKSTTRECNGEKDWLIEVECEDSYDGMIKTLAADSDICCSMFTPKPDRACGKCERFDGTYCHGPNGTITISYKALFGEPVNCPSYSERKIRESEDSRIEDLIKASKRKDDLILDYREKLKKANEAGSKIVEENIKLEKEIDDKNKDIDILLDENKCLKLRNDNQVTMIQGLKLQYNDLSEKLKKVKSHDEAITKHFQNDEKLIDNIQKVIFPQEEGSDYTYSYDEILDKVKELKEELEKLKNTDISKVPICKEILSTISELKDRNEELEKKIDDKNKDIDILLEDNKRMNERNSELYQVSLNKSRDIIDIGKKLKRQECLNDINADIMSRLMLENQRLLTRNRKLQVKLNDILLKPESNRLEEEDK